jgi:hypothetical protein
MTVCGACGSAEPGGGAFCGACGAFLEFVGVPAARSPEQAEVEAAPAPVPAAAGTAGAATAGAGTAGAGIGAVLPGEEAERRAARRAVEPAAPGQVVCPSCRYGNAAARAFCRRCGTVLEAADPAVEQGWWRRLLEAVRDRWRRRRSRDAGERPRRWERPVSASAPRPRRGSWLRRVSLPMHLVTPVLLVLAMTGVMVPSLRSVVLGAGESAVVQVRRVVAPQLVPVRPVRVTASSAAPGHPAEHAVDGVTTTSWAEGGPGPGPGERLVLEYDRPVDLRRLGVRLGTAGSPEAYARDPRPERVLLVAGDQSQEVLLRDTVDLQDHDVDLDDVRRLEVRVLTVFGGQDGSAASLTEVTGFRVR